MNNWKKKNESANISIMRNEPLYIEVEQINEAKQVCKCLLWTGEGAAVIYMKLTDYERLNRNGFFIKDYTDTTDGQPINTTVQYFPHQ